MKRLFVCIALACLVSTTAVAQTFRINDIRVEGLQRVSAGPVFAALPLEVGDIADPENIRNAIRSLFATGLFAEVDIAQDGNILIVSVKERPAISELNIEGNKAIKTEALTSVMSDNGLEEGQIFQRDTLEGILRELRRQYMAQGRYGATVEADIEELPNNQVKVNIQIDEGGKSGIRHINIVGNEVFDDETLLELFELDTTNWLSWITSNDAYAREKLQGDIETLESFYLDRGYLDFEVKSTQVSLGPDKESVYITLNVSEGDVYTVSGVELAGDPVLKEETLLRLILLKEGDTFSQQRMTSSSEYITTILGNSGYTNAKVEGIPERNPEDNTVKLTFFVDPADRVYVRRIEFRGNTRTADNVLRREMRQMEGASASNARIEQSKVRLERLGFFKEVTVDTADVPGSTDLMDVTYTVEEQPSGSIQASLGYAERSGFMLGASIQQNNWFGTGKQVGFSVNTSDYSTNYSLNYVDPYFTPDGVSRGISAYYKKINYDKVRISTYNYDTYGVSMNFGYPLSEIQRLNFGLGLSNLSVQTGGVAVQEVRSSPPPLNLQDNDYVYLDERNYLLSQLISQGIADIDRDGAIENIRLDAQPVTEDVLPNDNPGFVDKYGDSYNSGSLNLGWMRSTLNRGVLATRGNSQQLSLEVTVPGSDLQYYKAEFKAQYFKPLTQALTLRLRTNLGYGDGYGDMEDLPFFENFFGGGFGSVRGFRRSSLGPKSTPALRYLTVPYEYQMTFDAEGNPTGLAPTGQQAFVLCEVGAGKSTNTCRDGKLRGVTTFGTERGFGGNVLMEFSAELIMPLPFIEDQRSTQFAAFIDAGNVFDTDCGKYQPGCYDVSFDKMAVSAGLGLTWISGFGPLTFSVAKPLNENPLDETEVFQFTMGAGF
jgi:outer membrane protein insertion porin family